MKYIEKNLEDEQTGAITAYHEISILNVDYPNNHISVVMSSFVSKKTKNAGKSALSHNSIFINNAFPENREVCVHDWILNELVKTKPENTAEGEMPNRYMFTNGTIKTA
ncbi:hypothetical protein [Pasteurella sp. PK-2025]|uniref:hypothetical protein n=1 Tax=unclassified Pasteurella TaxID=2621516 RepID=UPI003C77EBAD